MNTPAAPSAPHADITSSIIRCAMNVHNALGPGFLETVYRNALLHELQLSGLTADGGHRVQVRYRDILVGEFIPDILVEESVIVELKAVRELATTHLLQLVNYLAATGIDVGLLLNFGAPRLEFKRRLRTLPPPTTSRPEVE